MTLTADELKNIKRFIEVSYKRINDLDDNATTNFNKKILWFTFLESIGHIVYSKKGNAERFSAVLRNLCKWDNVDKIIMPLLYMHLIENDKENAGAIKYLEEQCWGDYKENLAACSIIRGAAELPKIDDIQRNTNLERELICKFTLGKYLWETRNFSVHSRWQVDFPTHDSFIFNDKSDIAIVCDLKKNDYSQKNWRIYVPELFLRKLAESALNNFPIDNTIQIKEENKELARILYKNFRIA